MVNNLKACSPQMYRLFSVLKDRKGEPITQEEIDIASGKKTLNPGQAKIYFTNLEVASENLRAAFEKQAANAAVSFFFI
jgi:hypothetical protein